MPSGGTSTSTTCTPTGWSSPTRTRASSTSTQRACADPRDVGRRADRHRHPRRRFPLQDNDGRSWWTCTDPWGGLAIRTGHRERLLIVPSRGEVLVTARYVRPGRSQPVSSVIVAIRDAEARRRAEANSAALISTVAHELRSPLTSVKGFSSTLLRRWDRFTDDQKRLMLQTIEADADRVTRLITELLDISRIDAGRLQVRKQPVDVPGVIDRHIERFVASGHERERFHLDDPGADLPETWADPDRLDQILANLIENAVRHGEGTVSLEVMATRSPAPTRPSSVTVGDEGEGISPEHYPLVFTRFWHGSRRGGTGLGLYVVRGLVEAHGGQIRWTAPPVAAPCSGSPCRQASRPTTPDRLRCARPPRLPPATCSRRAPRQDHAARADRPLRSESDVWTQHAVRPRRGEHPGTRSAGAGRRRTRSPPSPPPRRWRSSRPPGSPTRATAARWRWPTARSARCRRPPRPRPASASAPPAAGWPRRWPRGRPSSRPSATPSCSCRSRST